MTDPMPDEYPATSAVLMAAAFVLEDGCKKMNDDFMRCRGNAEDSSDCVAAGIAVESCIDTMYTDH